MSGSNYSYAKKVVDHKCLNFEVLVAKKKHFELLKFLEHRSQVGSDLHLRLKSAETTITEEKNPLQFSRAFSF